MADNVQPKPVPVQSGPQSSDRDRAVALARYVIDDRTSSSDMCNLARQFLRAIALPES